MCIHNAKHFHGLLEICVAGLWQKDLTKKQDAILQDITRC